MTTIQSQRECLLWEMKQISYEGVRGAFILGEREEEEERREKRESLWRKLRCSDIVQEIYRQKQLNAVQQTHGKGKLKKNF